MVVVAGSSAILLLLFISAILDAPITSLNEHGGGLLWWSILSVIAAIFVITQVNCSINHLSQSTKVEVETSKNTESTQTT